MEEVRVFITGTGIISPLGRGLGKTEEALQRNSTGITDLSLFSINQETPLPVGEIRQKLRDANVPRTHLLALEAAEEAMEGKVDAPDAIVLGTTTGGMAVTESLIRDNIEDKKEYTWHGTGTVAEFLAEKFKCKGPVITVTTACSSGTAAITIGAELIRSGKASKVLAGGADSLCRLTYYGFNALQLIDPEGARPFDKERKGMTVSEGAAMVFLEGAASPPESAAAEILGSGLSCDAYHPASPHPEGDGAKKAMAKALKSAHLKTEDIDYINLHGTGTRDNDQAEGKAVSSLFKGTIPYVSSVKGATGHSLGAAGAIEAVISAMAINRKLIPANTGSKEADPEIPITPVTEPINKTVKTILSNSFGFGGNNASIIIGAPYGDNKIKEAAPNLTLKIINYASITGAGHTEDTMKAVAEGNQCHGTLPLEELSRDLPPREVRRLKRLPRTVMALGEAVTNSGNETPSSIFLGTGWGALSETYDFLTKLFESEEKFTSPTDFVGSVHNAPAGQLAIKYKSTGPNITTTGGDYSFEQALITAAHLISETGEKSLIIGADEYHEILSPRFDRSVSKDSAPSDGGGALLIQAANKEEGLRIKPLFYQNSGTNDKIIENLAVTLTEELETCGAIMAGIPAGDKDLCLDQLQQFLSLSGASIPVIDYRAITGEFASASAAAAVIGASLTRDNRIPVSAVSRDLTPQSYKITEDEKFISLGRKGILILGLGNFITAMGILP